MTLELSVIVADFADGLRLADAKRPQAISTRSKALFQPGIGPHSESRTVELVMQALEIRLPDRYGAYLLGVPYPSSPRQRCDLCLGRSPDWEWTVEVKMLRFLGDNGGLNDNILMHILSPYPPHRSALTDCKKLIESGLHGRKAILIYGFEHRDWPLEPAIEAFETLARARVHVGTRCVATFEGLVHPIHAEGKVFAWEIGPQL